MKNIAIIGTGYVGLVTGVCFADRGHQVICVDVDEQKINQLKQGVATIYEPGLDPLLKKNLNADKISFTRDLAGAVGQSEIIFIAVGTPALPNGEADLSYVKRVASDIGRTLDGYKVIVNKSTA